MKDSNSENVAYKLKFLERQHEEKLEEMKNLTNDVKLRDYEIKNLQECITYVLQEKNDLQNKVKVCNMYLYKIILIICIYLILIYNSAKWKNTRRN